MADTLLVRALKSKPKSLNLSNKKLDRVPKAIGKLDCVVHLQLKNNKLTQLPFELSYLYQVNSVVSFRDLSQARFLTSSAALLKKLVLPLCLRVSPAGTQCTLWFLMGPVCNWLPIYYSVCEVF